MPEKTVQSIERAFDILEVLATEKDGLGVTEIGQRLGLHKSTVHRLLNSMGDKGYIEKRSDNGAYRLGLKFVELCSLYLNSIELKTEAQPYLRRLVSQTTQPAHLAILHDGQAVYIDKVEAVNSIRMYSQIGRRIPVHCSAIGKVLMAGLPDHELEELLHKVDMKAYTANTIVDTEQLKAELEEVRQRGWARDDSEYEEGIRCIAAPVYDYRGKVIAAVSTSGPFQVFFPARDTEIANYVKEAAYSISRRMGYRG